MKLFIACLLFATVPGSLARFRFFGCQHIPAQPNFDLDKYLGTWHEIERLPPKQEGSCVETKYTRNEAGDIRVENSFLGNDHNVHKTQGKVVEDRKHPGHLKDIRDNNSVGRYQVVETDYKTYSLEISCTSILFYARENAWILSRNVTLSNNKISSLKATLDSYKFRTDFINSDQSGCSA